jgi:hypothetical protein
VGQFILSSPFSGWQTPSLLQISVGLSSEPVEQYELTHSDCNPLSGAARPNDIKNNTYIAVVLPCILTSTHYIENIF